MLNKYECEKCGSVCYIESEVWESCPICEETPEEKKQRERAEHAEYVKLAAVEKCDSYANRYAQAAKERDRYAQLLHLCSRFAGEAPEVQVRTDEDEIIDGLHLVAQIEDVLEGESNE